MPLVALGVRQEVVINQAKEFVQQRVVIVVHAPMVDAYRRGPKAELHSPWPAVWWFTRSSVAPGMDPQTHFDLSFDGADEPLVDDVLLSSLRAALVPTRFLRQSLKSSENFLYRSSRHDR